MLGLIYEKWWVLVSNIKEIGIKRVFFSMKYFWDIVLLLCFFGDIFIRFIINKYSYEIVFIFFIILFFKMVGMYGIEILRWGKR